MRVIKFKSIVKFPDGKTRHFFWAPFDENDRDLNAYETLRDSETMLAKGLQFIGLHDKSGREIYEGDILTWTEEDKVKRGFMEWDNSNAQFRMKTMSHKVVRPEMLEVIGNIYENKCDTCGGAGSYEVYHDDSEIVKGEATCIECDGHGFVIE